MKRRCFLTALPVLCWPSVIRAQQTERALDERVKEEAEAAAQSEVVLPIYPRRERAIVDAPFSASFLAKIQSSGRGYPIRTWRRSDGSTRLESVLLRMPLPADIEVTTITDYGRMKTFGFLTIDGVLREDSVTENSISPEGERTTGNSLIETAWKTLATESPVVLEGVDDRPCERLLLESPNGSKKLEVWISKDLQVILKEELRQNDEMQHLYVATRVERAEPDSSLFDPRA